MCIYIYAQYHTPPHHRGEGDSTTPQGGEGDSTTPHHTTGGEGHSTMADPWPWPGGGWNAEPYIYTYTHQLAYRPYQIGVRRMATFFEIWPSVSECQGRAVGCWYIDTIWYYPLFGLLQPKLYNWLGTTAWIFYAIIFTAEPSFSSLSCMHRFRMNALVEPHRISATFWPNPCVVGLQKAVTGIWRCSVKSIGIRCGIPTII